MARANKQFNQSSPVRSLQSSAIRFTALPAENSSSTASTMVVIEKNSTSIRNIDFGRWYGKHVDAIVATCQSALEVFRDMPALSRATIVSYFRGIKHFLDFCILTAAVRASELTLADIHRELIEEFIGYLSRVDGVGYTSQKGYYTQVKAVLILLSSRGMIPSADVLFPANPYPASNKRFKGQQPYSEAERERLVKALKVDIAAIFNGRFEHRMSEAVAVCLLAICLRTGRNTQPMLELSRDALKEHPLAPNLRLLTTQKRRANATQQTVVSGPQEGETFTSIQMDAVAIYEQVKALTAPLAEVAPVELSQRLWLYRSAANRSVGEIKELNVTSLQSTLSSFSVRHNLRADDGSPLTVNVSRLRKTLADRLWRLSGGDPFAVARVLGHGVRVADAHYLAVTPELERNWKFLGESLVMEMRAGLQTVSIRAENTPVGRCKDPINGERAPATGNKPCIDFLSCFGCRSYVITSDERDLYRLYSFYWFLIGERQNLGASKWSKVYGWIVRVIDTQVTFKFDSELISRVREHAKRDPHPYWRSPEIIEAARTASNS